MEKELRITAEQIDNMGDYKYLINNKNARKLFINSLEAQFDRYGRADVDEYSDSVNNDILKSKILTRIAEVKTLNSNYNKSFKSYEGMLEAVRKRVENEYRNREMERLKIIG